MGEPKRTRGEQIVSPFFCPRCQEITGEQQSGADIDCAKGEKKLVQLCYRCGYTRKTKVGEKDA